jgi:methylated-DNA-[protein]-cysteine S-methyltransferase
MQYNHKLISSPVGELTLVASPQGLVAILWEKDDPKRVKLPETTESATHPILNKAEKQLGEYFSGKREEFQIPLDMQGTEFQKQVWAALLRIPFGKTASYGELARGIKRPKASRAVGAANGRNPISIIVPCHRVIGANGKLVGFAGGLKAKTILLKLEGCEETRY